MRAAVKGNTARGLALFASLVLATAGAAPARHAWTQPGHLRIGVVRTIGDIESRLIVAGKKDREHHRDIR